ncbi:MAG TPA: tRNA glutamyl-Q(34) synthetase GluQRS [Thermoanaerobaculia bacterium]|nr:tRNA glutamyl-Q(34) synthetase GluQRS [Thermoanaerobaculia bacterium]
MCATASPPPTGRFAPSPTGPLHLGSLLAAVGSWLSARSRGGRWLVRIEDLDTARVIPGSAEAILESLARYGLEWDDAPVRQSERTALYEDAVRALRSRGRAFDCSCTRADLQRSASAPAPGDEGGLVYPGRCRNGAAGPARSTRFLVREGIIGFDDAIAGHVEQNVAGEVGDFVIRRADGPFAYQLAVVVDDADQGVTEVVRGGDLLSSTARQIALQRVLGIPTPAYAHLPLLVDASGAKLGKRGGALPLPSLDSSEVVRTLALALSLLGIDAIEPSSPERMLRDALASFDVAKVPSGTVAVSK